MLLYNSAWFRGIFLLVLQKSCYFPHQTCCFGRPSCNLKKIEVGLQKLCVAEYFLRVSQARYFLPFPVVLLKREEIQCGMGNIPWKKYTCTCFSIIIYVEPFIKITCQELLKLQKLTPNVGCNAEHTPCVCWFSSVCRRHRPIQRKARRIIRKTKTNNAVTLSPITTLFNKLLVS